MSGIVDRPVAVGASDDERDREALARLASGDIDALQALYDRHSTMAYSIALRISGDPSTAEEVVQDAFLGIWRHGDRYVEGRASVRTWLLSIVHHRAIDRLRRRRPTTELPDADDAVPSQFVAPDVWPEVAGRLDRDAVQGALASIPTSQREAIELAYFGGLTQVEIAERIGAPLGTVKSRIRLGLVGLRAALEMPPPPRSDDG